MFTLVGSKETSAPDETSAERDRRFELVLEPFLRLTSAGSDRLAWLIELGSTRPALRFGVWISY